MRSSNTAATPAVRRVGIGRACEILGVNPATLRQWTDEGKVSAYVTPGGHRRYDERELLALVGRGQRPGAGLARPPVFASPGQYEALVRRLLEGEAWFHTFDAQARHQFRLLGNSMLHLLGAYVLADSADDRARSLARAREVASEHGAAAAAAGLSAREATRAFLQFRTPILETLAEWARVQATESSELAEMLRRVNEFMDEMLLAMVAAHDARLRAQPTGTPL